MNINATLVIQMINFGIMYWMLRALLFKPVIYAIDSESSQKIAHINIIEQLKNAIATRRKKQEHNWYICRQYGKNEQPAYVEPISLRMVQKELHPISSAYVDSELIETLVHRLEEKIKHVH